MHTISIIIPILNEASHISKLLHYLLEHSTLKNIAEIMVVDGGSTDGSQDIVLTFSGITLLHAEKGRAKQMNLGAKQASGSILYFLHADSLPPKNFDTYILNEIKKGHLAGCFRMKFKSNHLWLKLAGWLTQLPFKFCRGGDQSLFITKPLFNNIGGFDETFTIYEDNDFISKLYQLKQFVVIQKWLITSPRCYYKNGIWTLQRHYWMLHLKKYFGASPKALNTYYRKHIAS